MLAAPGQSPSLVPPAACVVSGRAFLIKRLRKLLHLQETIKGVTTKCCYHEQQDSCLGTLLAAPQFALSHNVFRHS